MKPPPVVLAYLAVLASVPSAGEAGCIASNRSENEPSHGGTIQLRNVNLPGNLMNTVTTGFGFWNECPGANQSFPSFTDFYHPDTEQVVDLRFVNGINPDNPASCAYWDPTDQEVVFFSSGKIGTEIVPCTRADVFLDTVTHELGHVLGLKNAPVNDPSCLTYIMGPLARTGPQTYVNRTLRGDECLKVSETHYTPFEQLLDACTMGDANACHALGPCEYPDSCNGSPVVIDLLGDGFSFTSVAEGVKFDIDGDRHREKTAWTRAGSDDSFLVLDRNRNGRIDGGEELFGDVTPLIAGEIAHHGFQALTELDLRTGNGNGFIDAGDQIFPRLMLWRDIDHDGYSDAGELTSLQAAGIVAIEVAYRVRAVYDEANNWLRYWSAAYEGDRRVEAVDVFFQFDQRD